MKIIRYIPNALTISRIILTPILILSFFLFSGHTLRVLSSVLFAIISITDFLDGHVARTYKAESNFGKCFDPIADKILVISTMIMLVHDARAWVVPVLIIIGREILVSGIREFVIQYNVVIHVSYAAKIKTAVQFISIVVLLINETNEYLYFIGNILLTIAAILSLTTMISYIKNVKNIII